MAAGIQGNDDSFVAFSFAIVSLIMIALYFPVFTGMIRDTYAFFFADTTKKRRRGADEDEVPAKKSWRILWDDFAELPLTIVSGLKYPGQVMAGARLLWANRGLGYSVFFWDCVRFCVRPRFIVLWLWIFLMSSAMYATMTFDPYGALGLTSSATEGEIKQAYRKLSKLNHPDVNKTEAAKAIYPTIKKAYKALVDRDAFEKEAENEEMSFGIGLPSWMTSHEHDGKILFALLGLLIAIPAGIWHHFRGNSLDKLKAIVGRVTSMSKQLEPLYLQLGIPLDPKFVERRRERRELTEILVNMGLLPIAEEALVDGFPHLSEFKRMCLQPEKHTVPLAKLGLDVSTHPALKNFFESYELEEPLKLPEGTFQKADSITYEAIVYIIRKTQTAVEKDLQEMIRLLQMLTNRVPEFRVVKKLERHHEELLETLAMVYRDAKPQTRDIRTLIEVPQRREELVRDIPKEIQGYFVALQQQQQQHQQMMMQQMMQQQRRR